MVAPKDNDAPTGTTDTNASTLCDWKVWNDIIGTESVANLPSGRGPSVLCGHGAETGSSDICLYNTMDHFELLHEFVHATSLDSSGCAFSDAGGNPLPR